MDIDADQIARDIIVFDCRPGRRLRQEYGGIEIGQADAGAAHGKAADRHVRGRHFDDFATAAAVHNGSLFALQGQRPVDDDGPPVKAGS